MRQVKKAFKMKYSDANNTNVGKKELQKLEVLIDQVRGMDWSENAHMDRIKRSNISLF